MTDHGEQAHLDDEEITALRRLLDRAAITQCVHRYARGLDRRDAELVASAYHASAVEDHGQYVGELDGLVAYLMDVHAPFSGYQRHVTTQNVDIDGDAAHAESYFLSVIRIDGAEKLRLTGGRYVDRLERRDREWRIAERVVVLEWYGSVPGGGIDPAMQVAPRLDRDDVSYVRPLHVTRDRRQPSVRQA
ncbi:MAG: nuclear transport factor 2 family protein [Ilumatobacteraceae bacterium]